MCAFVANQRHGCRSVQVLEWLRIRKTESVVLCQFMHRRSGCHAGGLSGFTTRLRVSAHSECESTHCVIRREMLASRKMSHDLNNVLQEVIKMINHIDVHARNSRLLTQLCEEMDTEHTCLLSYTEVRWFSRGRSLASFSVTRATPEASFRKNVTTDSITGSGWPHC